MSLLQKRTSRGPVMYSRHLNPSQRRKNRELAMYSRHLNLLQNWRMQRRVKYSSCLNLRSVNYSIWRSHLDSSSPMRS